MKRVFQTRERNIETVPSFACVRQLPYHRRMVYNLAECLATQPQMQQVDTCEVFEYDGKLGMLIDVHVCNTLTYPPYSHF